MATTLQSFGLDDSPQNISESDLTATVVQDVKAGVSGTLWNLDIDNSANGAASYVRIWDNPSPTNGTTDPDIVIMIPASVRRTIEFVEGFEFTNLSFAAVTTGGTAGTTDPTSDVIAEVMVT